jgi:hypothetical protein
MNVFSGSLEGVSLAPVVEVMLKLDEQEEGFRIVRLAAKAPATTGSFAFVWGNISARLGDEIPAEFRRSPEDERGVELEETYEGAVRDWCARAMWYAETNPGLAAQMLEMAGMDVPQVVVERLA